MVPSLSLLSRELSVSVKENPDRKKKEKKNLLQVEYQYFMQNVFMGTTNGGLLGKYFNMKVKKCEIQYSETCC